MVITGQFIAAYGAAVGIAMIIILLMALAQVYW